MLEFFLSELEVVDEGHPALTPLQAAPLFSSRKSRICALFELVAISLADGSSHESESLLLSDIIRAFDVSPIELERITNWVRRQAVLLREADQLISSET